MANPKAQAYRSKNASKFKQIGEGVFGGYKKGVPNGPEPRLRLATRRRRNPPTDE